MEISNIGADYLNNFRMTGQTVSRDNNANAPDFADILRRTSASASEPKPASDDSANSSKFATIDREGKLFEQCLELEIFLVKTLISSMRSTVEKTNLIDEGFAGKMYEDMLYDEYARDFTKNANFGFAELAYLELTGQRGKIIPLNG